MHYSILEVADFKNIMFRGQVLQRIRLFRYFLRARV